MAVFFVFSDEAGQYQRERTDRFLRAHPYYCRATIIIDAADWIRLRPEFYKLKERTCLISRFSKKLNGHIFGPYTSIERIKNKEKISKKKPYYFLRNHNPDDLLEFVKEALDLLKACDSCHIIYTVTINDRTKTPRILQQNIIRMHLQDIMQRVEMQIQTKPNSIGILFFDPVNSKTDKYIREAYQTIYQEGDFIVDYSHIKDSIAFELSHHSFGVQLADYCAGILDGCLKNYEKILNYLKTKYGIKFADITGMYGIMGSWKFQSEKKTGSI